MFQDDSNKLLLDISKNVLDSARQISSPNIDLDKLKTIARTMEITSATLMHIYETEKLRLK